MAKEISLAQRGLIVLGLMLVTAVVVLCIILFRGGTPPVENAPRTELVALAVANPIGGFPDSVNWGALAVLGQRLPDAPGKEVRYNAALSFARRGSAQIPLDVFCQMLDEDLQMRNFKIGIGDGKFAVDEYAARQTVLTALKEFAAWHKNKKAVEAIGVSSPAMQRVYAAVDKLTKSENPTLRKEAESIQEKVKSGVW
jgi:hypothetical protein